LTVRGERRRPGLLGRGQFLPQPSHGPVEVVQRQALGAGDGVVGQPSLAGPVGAGGHEAVEDRGEDRPLHRELEGALG
jgi:hypothetical protein